MHARGKGPHQGNPIHHHGPMPGGFTEEREMTEDVKAMAIGLKAQIEAKMNATYTTFEPQTFRSQVVAGTNYTIKIKVDGDKVIEAKVFKPLPCNGTELQLKTVIAI